MVKTTYRDPFYQCSRGHFTSHLRPCSPQGSPQDPATSPISLTYSRLLMFCPNLRFPQEFLGCLKHFEAIGYDRCISMLDVKAPCLATHVGCGSAVDMPTADVHILNDDLFGVGSCGLIAKQSVGTPGEKNK